MHKALAHINGKKRSISINDHVVQPLTRPESLYIPTSHLNIIHNTKEITIVRRRLRIGPRPTRSMKHPHMPIKSGQSPKRSITNTTTDHHLPMLSFFQFLLSAQTSTAQMSNQITPVRVLSVTDITSKWAPCAGTHKPFS